MTGAWVFVLVLAAGTAAQTEISRGRLVEGVACRSDPSQTYTLYLPSAYASGRRWPVLLIFDPRGRSALAAELFREAAEQRGFVLVASNDTRSGGPADPNVRALRALWSEVHTVYASDPQRLYAAGFSGGGMLAWDLGRNTHRLAGVIASGSLWTEQQFDEPISFPSFGAAGDTDFNNTPMRQVHARLREWGTPERLEIFEGSHSWMPAALAVRALEWLDLQAMRQGLLPRDGDFVARAWTQDLERAAAQEAAGQPLAALRSYESATTTFAALLETSAATQAAARLRGLEITRRALEEEKRWDGYEQKVRRRFDAAYRELYRSDDDPLPVLAFRRSVALEEVKKHAAARSYEGIVGRRLLETFAIGAGYHLARQLLERAEYRRAAAALTVATEAVPERPYLWYDLGCAFARAGDRKPALDALERAAAKGYRDAAEMATDEDLASLRDDPRFKALLAKLREHVEGP